MNPQANPTVDEPKLSRTYRIRVTLFAISVLLALGLLGSFYQGIQTLHQLDVVERERDQWQGPADVVQELNLKEGSVVVDLGSGVGYFAMKLSNSVGRSGKVLPVDILRFPLNVLRTRALIDGKHNIYPILGEPSNPQLPVRTVDAVLIANTYHELTDSQTILDHVFRSLRSGGRLVIVDRGSRPENERTRGDEAEHHHIAPGFVADEVLHSGFEIVKRDDHFIDRPGDEHVWWLIVARRP